MSKLEAGDEGALGDPEVRKAVQVLLDRGYLRRVAPGQARAYVDICGEFTNKGQFELYVLVLRVLSKALMD